jgi:glycosyltransferase involved in cell wall biosynthesis
MAAGRVDLAVVGQDPWFGGGFRSMAAAFWEGATAAGREPHLYYLSRSRAASLLRPRLALRSHAATPAPFSGTAFASVLPELDSVNQLAGGSRMASALRDARSLWVVAASAPYGYAALRSGRPYACWIATSLEEEWEVRLPGLPRSRRAALRVNAPLLRRMERDVLRGARAVYAISPYSRHALAAAAGLPAERVRSIPIPIDFEEFPPEPDDVWSARLEAPVISFVGRAGDPRKNLGLLLGAFVILRERFPKARLRLIGEPPPASARLPAGVDVVGRVPSVAQELRASTLFVLPSLQEGFGIVVAEALACGVPAITTPSGGPEELVREAAAGRVLDGFGEEELAAAAVDLLSRPGELLAMRRRGREHVVREHSPERFREALAAALAEADAAG